jgi:hypothetical protein
MLTVYLFRLQKYFLVEKMNPYHPYNLYVNFIDMLATVC